MSKYSLAVVAVTRRFLEGSSSNKFTGHGMLRTYELHLRFQRNPQLPRDAVNSSGLAVSRTLYDLFLLLGWCCMEAAATGVCAGSLQWCLPRDCRIFFFLNGVSTANHLFLPAVSQTSPARAFYVGWQPCDTYRN